MKKIFLIFSIFLLVFPSCETDVDVHATWEEIAVVYGLLDQSQDRQYIRINKAYVGVGDALQMADIADSINFLPEDMLVLLHKIHPSGDTLSTLTLYDTIIEKEDGDFSIDANIIYTANNKDAISSINGLPDVNFFTSDNLFALTIKNTESGNFVSASTELIGVPLPPSQFFTGLHPVNPQLGFYNPSLADSAKFRIKTLKWNGLDFTNAEIFQIDVRFNYKENNIDEYLIWRQPLVGYSGSMKTTLDGAKFFNYLSNNLEEDNSVIREFLSLDVIMTIGASDLATYIALNAPFEGIVQERPEFSNINNGLGLFSSRYTYELLGVALSADTQDFLKNELNRNFQ